MHYVCDVKVSKIAGANEKRDRYMFCADIFCGRYTGQTGCESLILSIRQAGEWSGCNASDVRQKAALLVFYCRLKS